MQKNSAKDLRALSDKELNTLIRELKEESLTLKIQQATGQLENNQRIKQVKKDIARALTIQSERAAEQA